ncbi:MAG: cyclase family protein [Myxococcota bacterium]
MRGTDFSSRWTAADARAQRPTGRRTVEAIPVAQLIGPAIVLDVADAAARDPDHAVSAAEIESGETDHGRIEPGSIVLVRTGWSRHWPDRKRYLGSDVPGDVEHLHFPGLARDAAELLVARRVDAVGIDTASLDPGTSRDFIAHRILNGAEIYGLENEARLEALPPRGALVLALPMKIAEGSGAPVRVVAVLP